MTAHCWVAGLAVVLPRGAMGLSAVCDCGISRSYSLTILNVLRLRLISHFTHHVHIKHVFFHYVVFLFLKIFLVFITLLFMPVGYTVGYTVCSALRMTSMFFQYYLLFAYWAIMHWGLSSSDFFFKNPLSS